MVKYWYVPLAIVLAVLGMFWDTLSGLYHQWMNNEDYSHGLLILPVSLFLIWEKRKEIPRIDADNRLAGAAGHGPAVGLFTVGELGAELFTTRASLS